MRYFFIIYALVAVTVVSIGGFRGEKFKHTPFELFPDMDKQDRIDPQTSNDFFADGMGARTPVNNTVPQGYTSLAVDEQHTGLLFTNDNSYLHTGLYDENVFGDGLPVEELGLNEDNIESFIKRGSIAFQHQCTRCHGESGNGQGVVAAYGIPGVADLTTSKLSDGAIYDIIVNGRGGMSPFGAYNGIKDRWAMVAYIRSLQYSRKAPKELVKEAFEAGIKAK